jgi:predicted nucleic acid binding AN1-type Zn finger protein
MLGIGSLFCTICLVIFLQILSHIHGKMRYNLWKRIIIPSVSKFGCLKNIIILSKWWSYKCNTYSYSKGMKVSVVIVSIFFLYSYIYIYIYVEYGRGSSF